MEKQCWPRQRSSGTRATNQQNSKQAFPIHTTNPGAQLVRCSRRRFTRRPRSSLLPVPEELAAADNFVNTRREHTVYACHVSQMISTLPGVSGAWMAQNCHRWHASRGIRIAEALLRTSSGYGGQRFQMNEHRLRRISELADFAALDPCPCGRSTAETGLQSYRVRYHMVL